MKKIMLTAVIVVIFAIILTVFVSADTDNSYNVYDVGSFVLKNNVENTLHTFGQTNEGWDTEWSNDGYVTVSEKTNAFPYSSLTDEGCLIYRNESTKTNSYEYITKTYKDALDLSEFSHMVVPVNCIAVEESESYEVLIELRSQNGSFSATEYIKPERWNGVLVDISSFEQRNSINSIRIAVRFEKRDNSSSYFEYYIDSIGVLNNENAINSFVLSADNYIIDGNMVVSSGGKIKVDATTQSFSIESQNFSYKDLGKSNCLRVDFSSESACMGVSLTTYNSGGTVVDENYAKTEKYDSFYTVYLPIINKDISKIKLTFDMMKENAVEITSIVPYSTYLSDSGDEGKIDTCAVDIKSETIIVKVSGVEEYQQKEIYLYSAELFDDVNVENLSKFKNIAKGNITSGDYIFRVKYDNLEQSKEYLYEKFVVAVKVGDEYKIIGSPKCITNPEAYSEDNISSVNEKIGKGVYSQSISYMQEVGASDTVIWVDIGKFFVLDSEGEAKFESGENIYYFNQEYAENLDTMIKNYEEKGISVTLVVVVSDTGNDNLNKALIHKDADLSAKYCAYNTSDNTGLTYLRAFCEYFVENYCKKMAVNRIVFGDSVSNGYYYNMGEKTLEQFTKEYAVGLRVVYNTVKSISSNTEVYTFVDGFWDRNLAFDSSVRYDSRAFVDSVNECISEYGNINWGIAQNLYPEGQSNYISYSDEALGETFDTDRVSFGNIGVMNAYFSREKMQYNNITRDYIVIEKSNFNNVDEETVTADYVYNCYKAMHSFVSAYITNRNCNYNDAMKYVDTSLSLMSSYFAPDVLGFASWTEVISSFSEEKVMKVNVEQSRMTFGVPEYKGIVVLSNFDDKTHGWNRYGFTEKISSGMSLLGKDNLLSLSLGNIPSGEKRGIVKVFDVPKDLSKMPVLHFSLNIASLPTGINSAEVTVMLCSGDSIYEVSGMIRETVWTDVYCDFSAFDRINKVESIKILVSSSDVEFEEPQMLINSIKALSYEYNNAELEDEMNPVEKQGGLFAEIKRTALPILIVVLVGSIFVLTYRRIKKY